ncbi:MULTISPECIES: DUF2225 domain-containing protein [unclassified Paenibacillus]|uniref:DUF2225 domain-containing protein n=1 Tax=unclassified Paenibacillus TaxID=185978 RepID=UPI001AE44EA4|nr:MULTISPECIES: DUF2225 domain-containing protein [unclassified Paenibacillus]MBP1154199.1 uncharacterized protein (DUF2225 family) [Paenibacillus sp. PvP091]MBP1170416.1 uncharacterized protein (DUF2225 family) [Paenibacillus sp. PvR098]MBP2441444.1 uncharacterized protein (DUF2225 family) [Paenibacillus sp. PvP052]
MVEPLFQVKVVCPHCETNFQSSRVRPSFKKVASTDTDFGVQYKEINPNFYVVRICPQCGFASTENSKDRLTLAQKNAFKEKVADQWSYKDYGGPRTWNEAIYSFKLALLCAQTVGEQGRVTAGLLHHIGWLYREKGDKEQEKRFLQYALEEYTRAFETEGGEMNNARLMYLLGELNRRLKHYREAVKWYGRVINDKSITDAAMIRACREQWVLTREDMREDEVEFEEDILENL